MTAQPTETPDPVADLATAPVDDAAIAAASAEEAAAEAPTPQGPPARRGPGRPKGSRNRSKPERDARAAGAATPITRAPLTGAAAASHAAAEARRVEAANAADEKRRAEEKKRRKLAAESYKKLVSENRVAIVTAVGFVTGLPGELLVNVEVDDGGQPVLDAKGGIQASLTPYGDALAPKPWQVAVVAEAAAYMTESDAGQRLAEAAERWAPYLYSAAAFGAVGWYGVATAQTVKALRPLVELAKQEQQAAWAAAQAARQQEQQSPGAGPPPAAGAAG